MYRGRPWTMRQYSGFGTRRGDQRAVQVPAGHGDDRAVVRLRPAHPDGLRLGPPAGRGRGGQGRRGHRLARRHGACCWPACPLDTVTTSMTINSTAAILLLLYQLVAEEQGVRPGQARRDDPERHPQGVRRPRHLHLPAPAVDAADHRHLRLLPRAPPDVEHHLDLRLPHPRGRLDRGPGDRLHPRQRHRLRAGRDRRRARRRRVRARGSASSGTPTTTSSRRSPSSGPPAGCGPRS